jgi:hypothetical protein
VTTAATVRKTRALRSGRPRGPSPRPPVAAAAPARGRASPPRAEASPWPPPQGPPSWPAHVPSLLSARVLVSVPTRSLRRQTRRGRATPCERRGRGPGRGPVVLQARRPTRSRRRPRPRRRRHRQTRKEREPGRSARPAPHRPPPALLLLPPPARPVAAPSDQPVREADCAATRRRLPHRSDTVAPGNPRCADRSAGVLPDSRPRIAERARATPGRTRGRSSGRRRAVHPPVITPRHLEWSSQKKPTPREPDRTGPRRRTGSCDRRASDVRKIISEAVPGINRPRNRNGFPGMVSVVDDTRAPWLSIPRESAQAPSPRAKIGSDQTAPPARSCR